MSSLCSATSFYHLELRYNKVFNLPHPLNPPLLKRRGGRFYYEGLTPLFNALSAEQKSLFGEPILATQLSHDEIIALIHSYAEEKGYDIHVGETEQKKNPELKKISRLMISSQEFGLPLEVFKTITEIDVLLLKSSTITHAFEVATTVETANKAINDRYRNLFAASPNLLVKTYVVVRDKDFSKAYTQVFSKANVEEGISEKIRIVRLSELTEDRFGKLLVT